MRDMRAPAGFGWNKAIQRMYCASAQEEKEMGLNPYDPNVTVAMMEEERAMKLIAEVVNNG